MGEESSGSKVAFQIPRVERDLYPKETEGLFQSMLRKDFLPKEGKSAQVTGRGRIPWPFNFYTIQRSLTYNEYHSTCLITKTNSTVGLGHMTEQAKAERRAKKSGDIPPVYDSTQILSKVDEALNPLCRGTWLETICDVAYDFFAFGNGYLEVVRRGEDGAISGLHHIPATDVFINVENQNYDYHFEVLGSEQGEFADAFGTRRFAVYGDKEAFLKRFDQNVFVPSEGTAPLGEETVSEVIHFRQPSPLSRWYGVPDWIACTASIELYQMITQYNYDFFLNRGVPEFLLFLIGADLDEDERTVIEGVLKANIGLGNSHKSAAININQNPGTFHVQLEKLAGEDSGADDRFSVIRETLASSIVSGHRVPPLLAGIQIPGKLGATNERSDSIQGFQALVIEQAQRSFQQTLGKTLGQSDSGLKLTVEDFEFQKITGVVDLEQMDTVSRMRQTPAQAKAEGRDLKSGVKD